MLSDVEANGIVQRLTACFNGAHASTLEAFCDRSLVVNSQVLGGDRRSNQLIASPLAALAGALRTRFPGTVFRGLDVQSVGSDLAFRVEGHLGIDDQRSPLTVQCTCRIRVLHKKIRELWFEVDEYDLLARQGRICCDPGQSTGDARRINQQAADALWPVLRTRNAATALFGPDVVVHANLAIYKDLQKGLELYALRLDGVGELPKVLEMLRDIFEDPVELIFAEGISQGFTTTFRGKMRARKGAQMERYDIVCGFITPADRVTECWISIAPPPTLMECLL
jgi:hypothetical protein